jgi:hypothetical protein
MILPLNFKSNNTSIASSPNAAMATHTLYANTSDGLGVAARPKGTIIGALQQTVPHRLSNEAVIAITLGACVIVSTWVIHCLTRRMAKGMLSRIWLDATCNF